VYYHDPKAHQLVLMSSDARLDASTQMPHNRSMFDKAGFVVLLVGQLAAVEPLYGGLARDFCLLEAGYMSQLLMSVAPAHRIGLCPVGAMEFEPVRHFFDLDDRHTLVHLLFGGPADGEAQPPPAAAQGATHPGQPASPTGDGLVEELRAFLGRKLPEQMRPSAYVLLDSLPLTPNGKVDRKLLPPPEQACAPIQPDVPPRNDIERTLAAIAKEILHTERLGIHQNFFDLGGTSIHMVQILNKVRTAFAREIPVTEIFRHPTISSLAGYLSEGEDCEPTVAHGDERASQRRAALARRDTRRREARGPDPVGSRQEGAERR
jgi:acyl carrier protein